MKKQWKLLGLATVVALAVTMAVVPLGTKAASTSDQVLTASTFKDLAEKVRPSVVSIKINVQTREALQDLQRKRRAQPGQPDMEELPDWLKEFFEDRGGMPNLPQFDEDMFRFPYGAGTGMIIRDNGYVLTNRHVLYHPMLGKMFKEGQITVVLADGTEYTGDKVKVVATDVLTDLAVLKIDATGLTPVTFGDSEELEIGEWVMAIGDPLELTGSVSQGIISGKGREIEIAGYARLLQTTAVINPGNSGGPLVNLDGEVIGVNNAIASNTRFWQGVGFAIPSSLASKIATDLIEAGHPVRGYIGIRMTDPSEFPALASHENYDGEGVGIVEVYEGKPADQAGLKPYDIITEINGEAVGSNVDVQRAITAVRPGDKVRVKVFRGGDYETLTITAGEWPTEEELAALSEREGAPTPAAEEAEMERARLGVEVENYPPDNPDAAEEDKGVVIRQIRAGSPAAAADLQVGDVIIEAEKQRVHDVEEFAKIIRERLDEWQKADDEDAPQTIILKVRRGQSTNLVFVPLPSR